MKKIKMIYYGKPMWFDSVEEAIQYFERSMQCCDAFSSEWVRYADIVTRLHAGATEVTDESEENRKTVSITK